MRTPKYTFNNKPFTSKQKIDEYIRNIKNELIANRIYKITPKNEHFNVFMELINHHNEKEEKLGSGVECFVFVRDICNNINNYMLRIYRTDGSEIDCSCCYTKITQPKTYLNEINEPMRDAINNQIIEYRISLISPLSCALCDKPLPRYYEIDHKSPSFMEMRNSFLNQFTKDDLPSQFLRKTTDDCHHIFRDEDEEFKRKWQKYHKEHSTYQVLCKQCNLTKGSK